MPVKEPNYSVSTEELSCADETPPIERLAKKYDVPLSSVLHLIGSNEAETARNIDEWQRNREPTGRCSKGRRRYGYNYDGTPIFEEQQIIAKVVMLWTANVSSTEIAQILCKDGCVTLTGLPWTKRHVWHLIERVGHDRDSA